MQSSLFYLHNRNLRSFNLKNEDCNICVEVFTATSYDVKIVEVYILHFA